jgi:glutaredoxin domain-containing cysteine-rich protein 1
MNIYLKQHMLSDSFCSDASSASSSDSMQYNITIAQSHLLSPDLIRSIDDHHKSSKSDPTAPLPTSLLMDIRKRSMIHRHKNESSTDDDDDNDYQDSNYGDLVLCNRESVDDEKLLMNFYNEDKFYKFHMSEHLSSALDTCNLMTHDESDENFAGLKDLSNRTATIRSAKGTIRGVKNRVRNGIATFLQMQQTTVKVSCTTTTRHICAYFALSLNVQ